MHTSHRSCTYHKNALVFPSQGVKHLIQSAVRSLPTLKMTFYHHFIYNYAVFIYLPGFNEMNDNYYLSISDVKMYDVNDCISRLFSTIYICDVVENAIHKTLNYIYVLQTIHTVNCNC